MSQALKSCASALSGSGLLGVRPVARISAATAMTSQTSAFSCGTHGDNIGLPRPRSSKASLQSQTPRGSDANSSSTQGSPVSCDPKASQPDHDPSITECVDLTHAGGYPLGHQPPFPRTSNISQLSKTFTDVNHRGRGALRCKPTPPSATEDSLTPLHLGPTSTPLSLDERQPTLTRDQYDEWAKKEIEGGRISRESEGGITSRRA